MLKKAAGAAVLAAAAICLSLGLKSDTAVRVTGEGYYLNSNMEELIVTDAETGSLDSDDLSAGTEDPELETPAEEEGGDILIETLEEDDFQLHEEGLSDDIAENVDIEDEEDDLLDVVPDEPENVVDTEEDDYYEIDEEYVYDDRPFDASYITGEGVGRIRKVIIAYAESLGGTFYSPYYKGGKAVSIQCCAYVNQVWKHVFGKDIYDEGVMTTTSHDGETIYDFLERTGARAGDILYVRYWKVRKNDWSTHFMILLNYDTTGVYVTDGYETDDGRFVVWRIDKKAIYSESNFFKDTGSDRDKPGHRHWTGKDGSFFKLYRMRREEWCNVANSEYYDFYMTDPMVRSVVTRTNLSEGTYTINATIYSSNGIDRVQFPIWTAAEGQDDLAPEYETDEASSGIIEDLGDNIYSVTYTVNIADHNHEVGNYMGEMYLYDKEGVLMTHKIDAVNMDGAAGGICIDFIPWSLE